MGLNLSFLLVSILAPGLVIALQGPAGLALARSRNRWVVDASLISVALIAFHHLWLSQHPDHSMAPSFILAALPLWALAVMVLEDVRTFVNAVRILGLGFALFAAVDFTLTGTRAVFPLADPNNFVTLLTLLWVPWAVERLAHPHDERRALWLTGVVTIVVCLAFFATTSRFGLVVIAGVVVLGGFVRMLGKVPTRGILVTAGGVAVAYLLNIALAETSAAEHVIHEISKDRTPVRTLLNQSTLEAITQQGGWLGVGLGGFALLYPQFRNINEQVTAGFFAHNDYLQVMFEGGVVLLVPLLLVMGYVAWQILRRIILQPSFHPCVGWFVALAIALVHAGINFVIVVLPLAALIGACLGVAARCDVVGTPPAETSGTLFKAGWFAGGLFALSCWLLLALDVTSAGVFRGQPMLGVDGIRQSQARMLNFAQQAEMLNARRAMPLLAQARLIEGGIDRADDARIATVDELYKQAIVADPHSSQAFLGYHLFLSRFGDNLPGHVPHATLLDHAVGLQPIDMNVTAVALEHYVATRDVAGVERTAATTLAWCELINRYRAEGLDRFTQMLDRLAGQFESQPLTEALAQCRQNRLKSNARPREIPWLIRKLGNQG